MYAAVIYISVLCTTVKYTEEIYTEFMFITDYKHFPNSLENWSLMDSVLYNADTVAKDTAILFLYCGHVLCCKLQLSKVVLTLRDERIV